MDTQKNEIMMDKCASHPPPLLLAGPLHDTPKSAEMGCQDPRCERGIKHIPVNTGPITHALQHRGNAVRLAPNRESISPPGLSYNTGPQGDPSISCSELLSRCPASDLHRQEEKGTRGQISFRPPWQRHGTRRTRRTCLERSPGRSKGSGHRGATTGSLARTRAKSSTLPPWTSRSSRLNQIIDLSRQQAPAKVVCPPCHP